MPAKVSQNPDYSHALQAHGLTRNESPVPLSYPQQPLEQRPNPQFQLQYANPAQRDAAERQARATAARAARYAQSPQAPTVALPFGIGQQAPHGRSSSTIQRASPATRLARTTGDYVSSEGNNGEQPRPGNRTAYSQVW